SSPIFAGDCGGTVMASSVFGLVGATVAKSAISFVSSVCEEHAAHNPCEASADTVFPHREHEDASHMTRPQHRDHNIIKRRPPKCEGILKVTQCTREARKMELLVPGLLNSGARR